MEHDAHLADDVDAASPKAKIVAAIVIVAALIGLGTWVVYGSGMWHAQKQISSL